MRSGALKSMRCLMLQAGALVSDAASIAEDEGEKRMLIAFRDLGRRIADQIASIDHMSGTPDSATLPTKIDHDGEHGQRPRGA
ncbi:hypothetical protein [Rhodomicrobium sp.]|uniref:hypothetical protein n=1 Tax=Rhodomicrobium sp. TaxID=2720632 RepID=UPI0039E60CD9